MARGMGRRENVGIIAAVIVTFLAALATGATLAEAGLLSVMVGFGLFTAVYLREPSTMEVLAVIAVLYLAMVMITFARVLMSPAG